jgi:hypothetical protein
MPWNLAKDFARTNSFAGMTVINDYNGGESQRRATVANVRRMWSATFRLTAEQLAALRGFYEDQDGGLRPFYFYDVTETEDFAYDETGASATGRYTVRFDSDWQQEIGVGQLRGTVTIRLIELAPPPE